VEHYHFAYTPLQLPPTDPFPGGQIAYRPLLIARIVAPSTHASFRCLVCADTGADHCIFPLSFAGAIGLDYLTMKSQNTSGVGNTGNITYYADIRIEVPVKVGASLAFHTMAGFTAGMDQFGMGLLGQVGFFESFPTTFNHKTRIFTIEA
jgi:hypothetical protein